MRLRYALLFLMMFPVLLFGQNKDSYIYGKITDDNGSVLELVNIAVLGTSYGVSSNSRGQYELHLPSDTLLDVAFSFIGYQQETRKIKLKTILTIRYLV